MRGLSVFSPWPDGPARGIFPRILLNAPSRVLYLVGVVVWRIVRATLYPTREGTYSSPFRATCTLAKASGSYRLPECFLSVCYRTNMSQQECVYKYLYTKVNRKCIIFCIITFPCYTERYRMVLRVHTFVLCLHMLGRSCMFIDSRSQIHFQYYPHRQLQYSRQHRAYSSWSRQHFLWTHGGQFLLVWSVPQ